MSVSNKKILLDIFVKNVSLLTKNDKISAESHKMFVVSILHKTFAESEESQVEGQLDKRVHDTHFEHC